MNHLYERPTEPNAPWNAADASPAEQAAERERIHNESFCRCAHVKRVHVRMKGQRMCLTGMIAADLAWVANEIKLASGWVPWFRTPEFIEAREIAREA